MKARVQHTTPCRECPFRRGVVPMRFLGSGNEANWYVESALADYTSYGLAPCHMTQSETVQLGDCACAGALIFAANRCKSPRDPERAEAVRSVSADHEIVFSTPEEFLEHHANGGTMDRYRQLDELLRTREMIRLYKNGMTHAQIGRRFDLSRQRVWQILAPLGHSRSRG